MSFSPAAWTCSCVNELIAFFTLSCIVESSSFVATFWAFFSGRKKMREVPDSTVVIMNIFLNYGEEPS